MSEQVTQARLLQSAPWLQTIGGRVFDYENLDANEFDADEAAVVLSRTPRFFGHTRWPYTVAQHSVLVARLSGSLPSLLHDVAEVWIGDMIAPLKHYLKSYGDNSYATLENRILAWVARVHNFPSIDFHSETIHFLDMQALATEARDVMLAAPKPWIDLPTPWLQRIEPWEPSYARDEWLRLYEELRR